MLVIGRDEGESFVVGEAIVTIIASRPSGVTVGIEAPRSVLVLRSELVEPNTLQSLKAASRKGHRS
jgi:carbon storage regulator